MKCSIITIHHIYNFGSIFQAYSLYRFLEQNGYDAEIIDYQPEYYNYGKNKLKTFVGRLLNLRCFNVRKKKFERFIRDEEKLSNGRFETLDDLRKNYGSSEDIFIAGGDQLWNDYHPCGKDDAYKLLFSNSARKLAYGTSMGRDSFRPEELDLLADKTKDFHRIMLREQSTVKQLGEHSDVPVSHVIDPVGLIDREEFEKIAVTPNIKEPYAVMYLADSGELLDEAVEILSNKLGLKIVHICGFKKKCYCDYFEKDLGPEEILGYILNAEFVLSASFHATMFSLLFNKEFATLLPGEKTNARINDILSYVGLQNRIIRSKANLSEIAKKIDYQIANAIIDDFKSRSKKELIDALKRLSER